MSLSAWVYAGWTLDRDRIARYGIDTIYIDPRADNAHDVIKSLRANQTRPGLYIDPHWQGDDADPHDFADWCSTGLENLLPRDGRNPADPFMADLEGFASDWIVAFIIEYRKHQPHRESGATIEPFQGGLIPTLDLTARGFNIYVQTYYGDMRPADAAACVLEQARAGDPLRVHPFYDGAALPPDHRDGCIFTLERLPA